uniref:Testis cDNA, clone: QtsA-21327, similar to human KSHV latent nuclear antigen interacting protein 1(KLIP1) n=1 Tax=Macaca fascicularis TaxID=9541 RepID=Q4R5S2_MACFA|nr:unnamed protein product [Macaca fascicularis]
MLNSISLSNSFRGHNHLFWLIILSNLKMLTP